MYIPQVEQLDISFQVLQYLRFFEDQDIIEYKTKNNSWNYEYLNTFLDKHREQEWVISECRNILGIERNIGDVVDNFLQSNLTFTDISNSVHLFKSINDLSSITFNRKIQKKN